eukprot:GHVU01230064.1.p1 GENE.GHVU01230064.1~~GHVU01230064.1.p1  ORF type:complete len:122 (-),score=4.95 GHVU01230064.1:164-529(-)
MNHCCVQPYTTGTTITTPPTPSFAPALLCLRLPPLSSALFAGRSPGGSSPPRRQCAPASVDVCVSVCVCMDGSLTQSIDHFSINPSLTQSIDHFSINRLVCCIAIVARQPPVPPLLDCLLG